MTRKRAALDHAAELRERQEAAEHMRAVLAAIAQRRPQVRMLANEFGAGRVAEPIVVTRDELSPERVRDMDEDALRRAVRRRLDEARDVFLRLPMPGEVRGLTRTVAPVEVVYERHEHGSQEPKPMRRAAPGAAEISRADEVFGWLLWLPADVGAVVGGVLCGFSYRTMAQIDPRRRSKSALARDFSAGVSMICAEILARSGRR